MYATIPAELARDHGLLVALSDANPGWKIEREADGSITMSPPAGSLSGLRGVELLLLLSQWNGRPGRGRLFDASTGFTMPDGAVLSPDAAWIATERWRALDQEQKESFAPIVPDVCIELLSRSDSHAALQQKLERYRSYGASYVVLIDPYKRRVWTGGTAPPDFPTDYTPVFDADA